MKIQVGTSGYGYKEWLGLFYPEKTPAKGMLRFYAERLGAVEINYTFHHMPTRKILTSWAGQVPDGFVFALKAPQVITHRKRMKNVTEEMQYFFETIAALEGKMGPVLFQFPPSLRASRALLEDFLALLPADRQCAFEFRGPTWREAEFLDLLRARGCSLCIADTDEAPVEEIVGTAAWGYLRLRRSEYTDADLAGWLKRIRGQQWQQAFVFFKHEEEARGPAMAVRFGELARESA